jgi:hypothetical protein
VHERGDFRFCRRHHVLPHRSIRERHLLGQRSVRVDGVAAVDEEVRTPSPHRLVQAHPAPLGIDAPALAGGVGRPRERHIVQPLRRRQKAALRGHARIARAGEIFEPHAVENALSGRQLGEIDAPRKSARLARGGSHHPACTLERPGGRIFDDHARRAIGAAPEDCAVARDITARNARANRRPRRVANHDRRRLAEQRHGAPETAERRGYGSLETSWRKRRRLAMSVRWGSRTISPSGRTCLYVGSTFRWTLRCVRSVHLQVDPSGV